MRFELRRYGFWGGAGLLLAFDDLFSELDLRLDSLADFCLSRDLIVNHQSLIFIVTLFNQNIDFSDIFYCEISLHSVFLLKIVNRLWVFIST